MKRLVFVLSFFILISSCTPSRYVVPLKQNETKVSAGFGGPLIKFAGAVIPIPFSSLSAAHGISDKVSLTGAAHLTAIPFGVAEFETGALISVWKKDSLSGISSHLNLNTAFNRNDFKVWPQLDLNYYMITGKNLKLYGGLSTWYELSRAQIHDQVSPAAIVPSIQAGIFLQRKSWEYQFELKSIAPYVNNRDLVVDYVTPTGTYGAFGFYFTVYKSFGR